MRLTKVRLGDYIKCSTKNNRNLEYGTELIEGVTSEGVFDTPRGSLIDIDLKPYKIVNVGAFVYNPSRLNLGSIAYRREGLCIVSHLYIVFYLNDEGKKIINPKWLLMYFKRKEFLREVTFRNFGSQRPEFNFKDMCEIIIPLPPLPIQQKYVDVYEAMLRNQQSYERGLEDLRLACEAYIEKLQREVPAQKIRNKIAVCEQKNDDLRYGIADVRGVSIEKKLIKTKADMMGVGLAPYYVIPSDAFVYVPVTSRNGGKISIAYNDFANPFICSAAYIVFRSLDVNELLPAYLNIFLNRTEFDRYARFHSWGSARETFDWEEMCDVEIPIPDIKVQHAIAELFTVYNTRKKINEQLKGQIRDICPILIKGSLEEGK